MVVTPQDPSFVREYTPQKAYTKSTVHSLQNVDPYAVDVGGNLELHSLAESVRDLLLNTVLGGFRNVIDAILAWINDLIAALLDGLDGVTGGIFDLDVLADRFRGTEQTANLLADTALTEVTTPFYASSGAQDMCTFNRTQMMPDEDGNPVSYTPSKSVFSVFFLRADRSGDFTRFKVIMGGDTSWFDIDHCYMALYRVHPVTGFMTREWISADLDSVLGDTRKEYSINMGKIVPVVQNEILALGQVQVAPGLAQTPRSLATLKQNGIELPPGTVPAFSGGYRSGTTMPATIAMADLTPFQNNILWFALSP